MRLIFIKSMLIVVICILSFGIAFCQTIELSSPLPIASKFNPKDISHDTEIRWKIDGKNNEPAVVQVYLNQQRIFPKNNPHIESLPGLNLHTLFETGNTYELKIWIPRTNINTSTWVKVIE
jgi:hypothetical protein